jgi:hypothetical protein
VIQIEVVCRNLASASCQALNAAIQEAKTSHIGHVGDDLKLTPLGFVAGERSPLVLVRPQSVSEDILDSHGQFSLEWCCHLGCKSI